jgi:hypothetical protein
MIAFVNRQGRDELRITLYWDDRAMMTQQLEVSILAAPLAAIDRRALSQAWCTALRFAPPDRRAAPAPMRDCPGPTVPASARLCEVAPATPRVTCPLSPHVAASKRRAGGGDEAWQDALRRPRARAPLAQRIERAFSDPRSRPRRATFALGRGRTRVHVILQSTSERVVLLAICPPEVCGVVSRALSQARSALAARGIGLEPSARESRPCS